MCFYNIYNILLLVNIIFHLNVGLVDLMNICHPIPSSLSFIVNFFILTFRAIILPLDLLSATGFLLGLSVAFSSLAYHMFIPPQCYETLLRNPPLQLYHSLFCSVDIVPVCKDSVICLPKKLAHQLGGIGQVCVVQRITNNISVIDPSTAQCKLHMVWVWVGAVLYIWRPQPKY